MPEICETGEQGVSTVGSEPRVRPSQARKRRRATVESSTVDNELPTEKAASEPRVLGARFSPLRVGELESSYLVDPASSHMLVSKIKPCMSKYKQIFTVKLRMAH